MCENAKHMVWPKCVRIFAYNSIHDRHKIKYVTVIEFELFHCSFHTFNQGFVVSCSQEQLTKVKRIVIVIVETPCQRSQPSYNERSIPNLTFVIFTSISSTSSWTGKRNSTFSLSTPRMYVLRRNGAIFFCLSSLKHTAVACGYVVFWGCLNFSWGGQLR